MKKFSKTFYFLILFLISIFFVILGLNFKRNKEIKSFPLEETKIEVTKNIIPVNEEINVDAKILATLVKENLPKDITNVKPFRVLNVPIFKQEYIRSCEEASLRMVLAFYGIKTNDMEIVKKVGYDPHSWDKKNNIWDDPYKMFVGSIDDRNKNGYGTFAEAVTAAAKTFGRDSSSYLGVSAQFLAEQIYNGYPVIVWGFYNAPPFIKYSWNTKEGKQIIAYKGEHARVVVGVYGDTLKPVGFLLNDPLRGEKNEYWSAERLMAHMNMFGNLSNQAVVVR